MSTSWQSLAKVFDVKANVNLEDLANLNFGVAANLYIAWPEVARLIDRHQRTKGYPLNIIDFGCGAGGFAESLMLKGYSVFGIDNDADMFRAAIEKQPHLLPLLLGNENALSSFQNFDVVCANLVTNYNKDLSLIGEQISAALKPGGIFVFSDLNREYIKACLTRKCRIYDNFDDLQTPRRGFITIGSAEPKEITVRDADEYIEAFSKSGLEFKGLWAPAMPQELIAAFSGRLPENYPEDAPRYQIAYFEKKIVC